MRRFAFAIPGSPGSHEGAGPRIAGDQRQEADEVSCLDGLLPPAVLTEARLRAIVTGTGADRVLVRAGTISEAHYAAALAGSLGCGFDRLEDRSWSDSPMAAAHLFAGLHAGVVPLRTARGTVWAIAPVDCRARDLVRLCARDPHMAERIVLTTLPDLARFIARATADAVAEDAAGLLGRRWPHLSAAPRRQGRVRRALATLSVGVALTCVALALSLPGFAAIQIALALWFLGWMGLRVAGVAAAPRATSPPQRIAARDLPIYTIIVPLYRETAALRPLMTALRGLDYPREKLDIKLVIEPDDQAMHQALAASPPGEDVQIVIAPRRGPRTKPKALNAALPFARGLYTVIFDAEDRPDPDQLLKAVACFQAHDARLACVQARLTIDNTGDSWLTRLFTAEYAGQFDAFLPGLARMGLPLPLGGSSNHFRTAVLREVGGWDAHNVTEDADLGIRLARFGYRSAMIDSSTDEEAPARAGAWIKQRTRWFKGWMQTWLVHMRHPVAFLREAGLGGFVTLQFAVAGQLSGALIQPLFLMAAGAFVLSCAQDGVGATLAALDAAGWLHLATVFAGYGTACGIGFLGLKRRGLQREAWVLLAMPLYWLLLSLAAWRALIQLVLRPTYWEKTQHGLARTSRRRAPAPPRRADLPRRVLQPARRPAR